MTESDITDREIFELERPQSSLLYYYAFLSMFAGPLFFVILIPLYFRYRTMRYRFDDEGVSMSWGVLFHREINLTYARIQDIHLVSNIVERWLGLARIKIQTASGSSKAEMTVEGISEFQALRDFLYARMRGTRKSQDRHTQAAQPVVDEDSPRLPGSPPNRELTLALNEVAAELRAVRLALEKKQPAGADHA
ncbi:MAG: PH domain-containing protein [Acidobacteriota bacterium]